MTSVNVFGTPVLDDDRKTRAKNAYNNPNADDKREKAIAYVRNKKVEFGNGVSTLCIFYNATGENVTFVNAHSFFGRFYDSPPPVVQNGQWGAFLHGKSAFAASGSVGYVLYRGILHDTIDDHCNLLLGWDTPWNQVTQDTHAYCDIFVKDTINDNDVYNTMEGSQLTHAEIKEKMLTTATIQDATSPLYEGYLAIEVVGAPKFAN